jgi:glycosyltransferase involved in cell wall biosynthesis
MKVLHVINSLIPGGVEVLLADMAPRFRDRGLETSIALLRPLDSHLEEQLRGQHIHFVEGLPRRIYSPTHIAALAPHIRKSDVVMSYLFPAQLWVAIAAARCGEAVPLVTTEQSTFNNRRRTWLRPLDRWMYSRYATIACNSQGTLNALVGWVPGAVGRLSIVPNGVSLERFANALPASKREVVGRDDVPVVIFVARFDPAKDHAALLRAMCKVPDAHLVLAGDGDSRPDMEALARKLEIAERVHFLGRRPDVPSLLKMADVYVHASTWEGFGLAAVEAMAAGLPVVATDVPGLAEVVGDAGLLFPKCDADKLATHISSLLTSPELRTRMKQQSLARAQQFSIERTVESYIKMFESVLAERRSVAEAFD